MRCIRNEKAQATIELAVMFPVILIIAVIAVNATTFFCQCAEFDRVFKQMTVSLGSSPAYGENLSNVRSELKNTLANELDNEFTDFEISIESISGNNQVINGTLKMHLTLFGMGLRDDFFGLPLPTLNHQQKIVLNVYKPGVIF